ncbi:MAG: ABC transporter ATP-binding protein [Anaerolineae bacterium]
MTIKVRNISFSYRPRLPGTPAVHVLNDCSLKIEQGEARAVMGASGAGKSTLGYILAGLAPRHTGGSLSGTVSVAGQDVTERPPAIGSVGLLFQDAATQLFNPSVEDEIVWGLEAMGLSPEEIGRRVGDALSRFDLTSVRHRRPWALSGGQQKRLALAALWAMRPQVLILDEPLSGLDPEGRAEVLEAMTTLRQMGTSLVIMTPRLAVAQEAESVSLLVEGQVEAPVSWQRITERESALADAGLIYPQSRWPDLGPRRPLSESPPAVEMVSLSFAYPDGTQVLHDLDLQIPQGQFVAIVGRNGAGKSTLVRHFNGLLRPDRGSVRIGGQDLEGRPTGAIAREVGFLFQRPEQQLFAPTVREELTYGPKQLGLPDVEGRLRSVIDRFALKDVVDVPPATLGYGDQRTVTLATLAMLGTSVVVLDEPTVGLDGRGLAQLLGWLAELREVGTTLILVTHEVSLAAQADRVIALGQGRIVADGLPQSVLASVKGWVSDL